MLKMLAQVQTSQSGSSLLRQLAGAMAQQGKTSSPSAEQHATDLSSLPPKLQTLLASIGEDLPQATPDQQAKLATFSAGICVRSHLNLLRFQRHSKFPLA